jgi:hypothetical protein
MNVSGATVFYYSATIAIWLTIVMEIALAVMVLGMAKKVKKIEQQIENATWGLTLFKDSLWLGVLTLAARMMGVRFGMKGGDRNDR